MCIGKHWFGFFLYFLSAPAPLELAVLHQYPCSLLYSLALTISFRSVETPFHFSYLPNKNVTVRRLLILENGNLLTIYYIFIYCVRVTVCVWSNRTDSMNVKDRRIFFRLFLFLYLHEFNWWTNFETNQFGLTTFFFVVVIFLLYAFFYSFALILST